MNSNNAISSASNGGYFTSLLVYAMIAAAFFLLGRNYDRIKQ